MDISGHWLPVGDEGQQGGSSNAQRDLPYGEAVSRRAAALLLISFYGHLKERANLDAHVTERYSAVTTTMARSFATAFPNERIF